MKIQLSRVFRAAVSIRNIEGFAVTRHGYSFLACKFSGLATSIGKVVDRSTGACNRDRDTVLVDPTYTVRPVIGNVQIIRRINGDCSRTYETRGVRGAIDCGGDTIACESRDGAVCSNYSDSRISGVGYDKCTIGANNDTSGLIKQRFGVLPIYETSAVPNPGDKIDRLRVEVEFENNLMDVVSEQQLIAPQPREGPWATEIFSLNGRGSCCGIDRPYCSGQGAFFTKGISIRVSENHSI